MTILPMKRLTATATLPTRGSKDAAGMDLYADIHTGDDDYEIVIYPGERAVISTGIAMAIPDRYYGQIAPRSGLAVKSGIEILAGIVDSDYRGEVKVALLNSGQEDVTIKHGDRIAQMLILPVWLIAPEEVDDLPETVRGADGFGSTGK